jgi:hypothetical protein
VIVGARAGIHWLLLTDAHHVRIGEPRICASCHHLVAAMPFCPVCGVAEHATPRSHRHRAVLHHGASADAADHDSGPGPDPEVAGGAGDTVTGYTSTSATGAGDTGAGDTGADDTGTDSGADRPGPAGGGAGELDARRSPEPGDET